MPVTNQIASDTSLSKQPMTFVSKPVKNEKVGPQNLTLPGENFRPSASEKLEVHVINFTKRCVTGKKRWSREWLCSIY